VYVNEIFQNKLASCEAMYKCVPRKLKQIGSRQTINLFKPTLCYGWQHHCSDKSLSIPVRRWH